MLAIYYRLLCLKVTTISHLDNSSVFPQALHFWFALSPQIVIIEHKSIICPGYNAVLHIHTCIEEVQITVSLSSCVSSRCCSHCCVLEPWNVEFKPLLISTAGLNLSGGQEDRGEEQNPTQICQARPGVHRQAPGRGCHLPGDLQGLPSDGTVHP